MEIAENDWGTAARPTVAQIAASLGHSLLIYASRSGMLCGLSATSVLAYEIRISLGCITRYLWICRHGRALMKAWERYVGFSSITGIYSGSECH